MIDPVQAFEMLPDGKKLPPVHLDPAFIRAGESGKTALWVVFVLMLLASAGNSILAWRIPLSKRLFHVVTTLITITAAISYFAMATGHGISYAKVGEKRHAGKGYPAVPKHQEIYRQIYWARYVDWAITTPLLLIDLGLLAGMAGGHLFIAIVADLIMILTGLFAGFPTSSQQKWGWYAIACIAFLVVIWHLAVNGRRVAASKTTRVRNLYGSLAGFTILVWIAYPIIWALSEGDRILSVDGEVIAYAVLDVLAKPIFGLWLLLAHQTIQETKVEVNGFWAHGLSGEGSVRLEDDDGA